MSVRAEVSCFLFIASILAGPGCTTEYSSDFEEQPEQGQSPQPEEPPGDEDPPATCPRHRDPTLGSEGKAELRHNWGALECLLGCGAEEALAERAVSGLFVVGHETLGEFEVASSDPTVATFERSVDGHVDVRTGRAGSVTLELRDATTEELIESFDLEVHEVGKIHVAGDWEEALLVMAGGATSLPVWLDDADGCRLVGRGAVDYQIDPELSQRVISLAEVVAEVLLEQIFGGALFESLDLQTSSEGSAAVVITAPSGASFELPVDSVPEDVVATVAMEPTHAVPVGTTAFVRAEAFTAKAQRVHDPACAWTIETTAPRLDVDEDRDSVVITSDTPATATVTCRIGTAEARTVLSFE